MDKRGSGSDLMRGTRLDSLGLSEHDEAHPESQVSEPDSDEQSEHLGPSKSTVASKHLQREGESSCT